MSESERSMARLAQDVTEAELAVLQCLWDEPAGTIRRILDRLYPGGGASQYATVQKLLDRLESKQFIRRDSKVFPHQFTSCVPREELIGRKLRNVADKLCGGSLTPLLTHLINSKALKRREIDELRELVEQLDRSGRKARK